MLQVIQTWFNRYFSDPEAVLLLFLLLFGFTVVISLGSIFIPVFISIFISYVLRWWVVYLEKLSIPSSWAYYIVYFIFIALFGAGLLVLLPLLWKQFTNLFSELPSMIQSAKLTLIDLVATNSPLLPKQFIETLSSSLLQDIQIWGKKALSVSLSSIPGIITWIVYLILVPLLVFFFLKDHQPIMQWITGFLPQKRTLLSTVWTEMNEQIGNYIRGKITEITIVGFCTYLVFWYFELRYPILLACLVGLSVVIPYIGAVVVTIPVILVGYFQWGFAGGWTGSFVLMFLSYLIVQLLDGNLLVPLLFSEAVNLHPIAIIISILFFGAIWGFWGIFFAIPLATLVKAVLNAWPKKANVMMKKAKAR